MGRLAKAKIDEIAKLREEGYTQKEIAERLHLHPRTVRKYDPSHEIKQRGQRLSTEDRLAALEEAVRNSWDLIELLHCVMLRSDELGHMLEKTTYPCPRCNGKLRYVDQEATYVCSNCGHKFPPSLYWCYHCLSQQEMEYVEATGELVCLRCGTLRYAH